jgi:Icc-related predicted phosphoesterase
MKLGICSDIHLEFGYLPIENKENIDVLILAGDILVARALGKEPSNYRVKDIEDFKQFFRDCSEKFPHVIYIMGNHEHYGGDFNDSPTILREFCESVGTNVYFLDNETKQIDDVVFIGQTLWTDFNNENPISMATAQGCMNDFRVIRNRVQDRKFTPLDVLEEHKKSLSFIDEQTKIYADKKCVVVGHHAPSHKSVKPNYERDYHVNGAYRSNLEEFIMSRTQIKLWVHGHTHSEFDYMVGDTRVVCNPRGYVGYERQNQDVDPYFPLPVEV